MSRRARSLASYAERRVAPSSPKETLRRSLCGSLVKIGNYNRVRLQANVAQSDAVNIRPGATVVTTVAGSNIRPIKGKITSIFPQANSQTRTVTVEAVIDNPDGQLLSGKFLEMKILTARKPNAITIPQAAVVEFQDQTSVWVVEGDTVTAQPLIAVQNYVRTFDYFIICGRVSHLTLTYYYIRRRTIKRTGAVLGFAQVEQPVQEACGKPTGNVLNYAPLLLITTCGNRNHAIRRWLSAIRRCGATSSLWHRLKRCRRTCGQVHAAQGGVPPKRTLMGCLPRYARRAFVCPDRVAFVTYEQSNKLVLTNQRTAILWECLQEIG